MRTRAHKLKGVIVGFAVDQNEIRFDNGWGWCLPGKSMPSLPGKFVEV